MLQEGRLKSVCVAAWLVLAGMGVGAGCESPGNLTSYFRSQTDNGFEEEDAQRRKYQASRSHGAMRWLLANRLQPGMSYNEVCGVLGEEGVREFNDNWLKTKGGNYRVDDIAYKFGPDDRGQSVYLVFREDALVNFDGEQFRGSATRLTSLPEDELDDE